MGTGGRYWGAPTLMTMNLVVAPSHSAAPFASTANQGWQSCAAMHLVWR